MCVLSPTIKGLDCLLRAYEAYCQECDNGLNANKSRNLYFGKKADILYDILLNGRKVEWAGQWPYLGVTLKSGNKYLRLFSDRKNKKSFIGVSTQYSELTDALMIW